MIEPSRYNALIPVKSLVQAKSRLADHLTLSQRQNLVLDMLHHVLSALIESGCFARVAVVSPDERVLARAREWGAYSLREAAAGHNEALLAAAESKALADMPALLTISADLPLLHVSDIQYMVELSARHDLVLAPAREGTGTNAILVQPPLAVPYLFGPNSFQRYQRAARQRNRKTSIYHSIGTSLDIDIIDDLDDLYEAQALSGEHMESWQRLACCQ
ncbi:MAG TPA: 2-phospho-L-lactate guanylyltransferase [Ktedonobacteraceae bacterium]|nr:2-phospho-L-lactate guanylyltransferase [Ktedonobacteraceae bacterium]